MKTKAQKRAEAVERLKLATYDNSKAKRLGTLTKDEWEARRQKILEAYNAT